MVYFTCIYAVGWLSSNGNYSSGNPHGGSKQVKRLCRSGALFVYRKRLYTIAQKKKDAVLIVDILFSIFTIVTSKNDQVS